MTEKVLIALIVAVVLIVALFMFKDKIKSFNLQANKKGVKANMKGQDMGINISGNIQDGNRNKISASTTANIENNQQLGDENDINTTKN